MTKPTASEIEKRKRIRVAVAAYTYEFCSTSIMSDAEYDALARSINLKQGTGDARMDKWFKKHFAHHTGMWVRNHPDPQGLANIALRVYGVEHDPFKG